jgi:hypothetical protein
MEPNRLNSFWWYENFDHKQHDIIQEPLCVSWSFKNGFAIKEKFGDDNWG